MQTSCLGLARGTGLDNVAPPSCRLPTHASCATKTSVRNREILLLPGSFSAAWHNFKKYSGFGAAQYKNTKFYQNGAIGTAVAPLHIYKRVIHKGTHTYYIPQTYTEESRGNKLVLVELLSYSCGIRQPEPCRSFLKNHAEAASFTSCLRGKYFWKKG